MAMFTTPDGVRLFYRDAGAGPAVLCLAGLTRNGDDFDHLLPHLEGYRVIRPDSRGRGRSDRAPGETYSVAQEATDVLALLDHLELDRVSLVGTSRGGLIALTLAALAPERLHAVVLNDIGPEVAPGGLAAIMDYVGRAPAWPDLESAARGLQAAGAAEFPGVPLARWRAEAAARWEETETGLALRYDPALRDALVAQAAAMEGQPAPDLWPLFDRLAEGALGALRGQHSDILAADTFAEMRRRAPDMAAAEVADRGHVPFLDEPEALAVIRAVLP